MSARCSEDPTRRNEGPISRTHEWTLRSRPRPVPFDTTEPSKARRAPWGGQGEKGAEGDPDVQMTLGRKQYLKDGHLSQVCNKPGSEPALSLAGEGSSGPPRSAGNVACGKRGVQAREVTLLRKAPLPHPPALGPALPRHQPTCHSRARVWARKKVPMSCTKRLLTNLTSKQTPRDRRGIDEDLGISRFTVLSIKQINSQDQLHSMRMIA